MTRYIDEKDVYKLVEPTGTAKVHCSQIDELPRADVAPKSEVVKEVFEDIDSMLWSMVTTTMANNVDAYENEDEELIKQLRLFNRTIAVTRQNIELLRQKYVKED